MGKRAGSKSDQQQMVARQASALPSGLTAADKPPGYGEPAKEFLIGTPSDGLSEFLYRRVSVARDRTRDRYIDLGRVYLNRHLVQKPRSVARQLVSATCNAPG